MRLRAAMLALAILSIVSSCGTEAVKPFDTEAALGRLDAGLEELRQQLRIPAISAAVAKDGEIIWAKGFGYADLENGIEAGPDTPYHLASLTKTFASTLLLQLVEQGKVDLDVPIADFGVELESEGTITVRHVFSHTSEGIPGSFYRYNGNRFIAIGSVIQAASGRSFGEAIRDVIIEPLGLENTAPGGDDERFAGVRERLAKPYQINDSLEAVFGEYPNHFSASAGLISSATDVARYSIAIDEHRFVKAETQEMAFTPTLSNDGKPLPYGLGWFTQQFKGIRLIWHYGYWICNSSLIVKAPDLGLTFVVLANTDGLSKGFPLGNGNVFVSPAAMLFVREFVFPGRFDGEIPAIDWDDAGALLEPAYANVTDEEIRSMLRLELEGAWNVASAARDREKSRKLLDLYMRVFDGVEQPTFGGIEPLASIVEVGTEEDRTVDFTLEDERRLRVYAVGEGQEPDMWDYGWIEDAVSGETVWKMEWGATSRAGGSDKNRRADETIVLPAGSYRLRYRSDDSHDYSGWNAMAPLDEFWGIVVYRLPDGE